MIAKTAGNVKKSTTRQGVRACIDVAERSFMECWRTLVGMKNPTELEGNALLAFQPTLATALFKLDDSYRKLIEIRKSLIQKKAAHSESGFALRMRALDKDLKGLRTAIDVGRSLGDAFAWVFYKQDQPLLERHFREPFNPHTPSGIGGIGELEFIRRARPAGFFVLYHGITTFLRIGDVSFYDLETRRISSLAELKSTPIGPGRLTVRVHMLGEVGKKMPFVGRIENSNNKEKRPDGRAGNAKFEDRLKKQMKKIADTVRPEGPTVRADLLDSYHIDDLSSFGKEVSTKSLAYQRVGKGLLLAGILAFRGRSLSSRIFSKASEKFVVRRMRAIAQRFIQITDPTLPYNSMYFSELNNSVSMGTPPLFWFPCDAYFLEAFYFRRALVYTLYNPAHLFKGLRELGYDVIVKKTDSDTPAVEVTKKMLEEVARIEQFDFFLMLIQQRFMREEKILEIFENSLSRRPKLDPGGEARMDFNFVHLL